MDRIAFASWWLSDRLSELSEHLNRLGLRMVEMKKAWDRECGR